MNANTSVLRRTPDWDRLFALAQSQSGYFTTAQAAESGYSRPLLHKYLARSRVMRVRRGIYRLVHFPVSENEELVVLWLWSDQAGVFSHDTALGLYDLSDVLPARVHMTVPARWKHRRLRVPAGLVLHFSDLAKPDRTFYSAVPITSPLRTLRDCGEAHTAPDLLQQAIAQASRRGLISSRDESKLQSVLDDASRAVQ